MEHILPPETSTYASLVIQLGCLGVMAILFIWVLPRMWERSEKSRQDLIDSLNNNFNKRNEQIADAMNEHVRRMDMLIDTMNRSTIVRAESVQITPIKKADDSRGG